LYSISVARLSHSPIGSGGTVGSGVSVGSGVGVRVGVAVGVNVGVAVGVAVGVGVGVGGQIISMIGWKKEQANKTVVVARMDTKNTTPLVFMVSSRCESRGSFIGLKCSLCLLCGKKCVFPD
jgi:hypothetical protein